MDTQGIITRSKTSSTDSSMVPVEAVMPAEAVQATSSRPVSESQWTSVRQHKYFVDRPLAESFEAFKRVCADFHARSDEMEDKIRNLEKMKLEMEVSAKQYDSLAMNYKRTLSKLHDIMSETLLVDNEYDTCKKNFDLMKEYFL